MSPAKLPLALLPGLLCDGGIWAPQLEALADAADLYVADFSQQDSIEAMACSVLEQVPGPFAAAGHSMGGRVALELARRAPGRILGLALINTGYTPQAAGEQLKRQSLIDTARRDGLDALVSRWIAPLLSPTNPRREAVIRAFREIAGRSSVTVMENHMRALLNRPDAAPVLAQVRCETLLLCGRLDPQSTLATHEKMAAAIPGSHLVPIEDCGHLSMLEAPEAVNDALRDWLGAIACNRTTRSTMGEMA